MRFPWTGAIERRVQRAIDSVMPELQRQAVEEARPAIEREAVESMVSEVARATSTYQLNPQVPNGYPGVSNSPYPLYGYDEPIYYAVPNSPKRRPGSLIDTRTMRQFADQYDVMRSCINHLKREIQAKPLIIGPKDPKDDSRETVRRVDEATQFFTKKGGLGELNETRRIYESKILEDVLVIGAFAAWKNKTKAGKLIQVVQVDASTIRPRMDAYGWPGPGEDWYEQWILGMMITGFKPDELTYDGLYPASYTPWFRSPVEYLISSTLSALKADEWNRTWLTDGNTPDRMFATPKEWTPEQIIVFTEFFNSMVLGDTRQRQKAMFVPDGVKEAFALSRKDQDFQNFELWLLRRCCAVFGVQPASIGFAGEQYKVSQEGSMDSTTQFGAGALLDLRKEHYDDILEDLGFDDLEIIKDQETQESPKERTDRLTKAAGIPYMTLNEARLSDGLDALPEGDVLFVPQTIQPLDRALAEPEPDPGEKDTDDQDPPTDTESDVSRWMRKALKRIRDGRSASCPFESASIPDEDRAKIGLALNRCNTAAEVRDVFAPYIERNNP